jgi:hypothetical protein
MENGKSVMTANATHHIHEQNIMINGQVAFFKNRRAFKLIGSYLVMSGFNWNSELISFCFKFIDKSRNPFRD